MPGSPPKKFHFGMNLKNPIIIYTIIYPTIAYTLRMTNSMVHSSSKETQLFEIIHSCSPWVRVIDPGSFSTLTILLFHIDHDTGLLTLTKGLQNKIFSTSCETFEEECTISSNVHILCQGIRCSNCKCGVCFQYP